MSKTPDYYKATNEAYEVLKLYDGAFPRIDIFRILERLPYIKLHTYSEAARRMGVTPFTFLSDYTESDMGFTVFDTQNNRWLFYYNDAKSETTIRFTLAHELGHIILRHIYDDDTAGKEANCFARNILCPVPLRDGYGTKTEQEYCECFFISEPMAAATVKLAAYDRKFITRNHYNAINSRVLLMAFE